MKKNAINIIFSSTGPVYSFDIAWAFQQRNMLKKFYTSKFYLPKNKFIYSVPNFNLLTKAANLLPLSNFIKNKILTWANYKFDSYVARRLRDDDYDIFYGLQGAALNSLRKAKKQGKMVFVEQHDCYYKKIISLVKKEVEINPDFASTFGSYWPVYQPYLDLFECETQEADCIVTFSTYSYNSFVEGGIPPEKILKVPLGVDIKKFETIRHSGDDRIFRIVFIGAIGQRKGIKYLLEAVKSLNRRDIKVLMLGKIIGSKYPYRKYQDFIEYPGFVGQEAFKGYMAKADIFCLPSINDSFGKVILEAMASGMPVVVSENTAGRDVVRDGVDGFVVPIRDVEKLKEKILFFYENREKVSQMGANARERAKAFTLDLYKDRLTEGVLERYEKTHFAGRA